MKMQIPTNVAKQPRKGRASAKTRPAVIDLFAGVGGLGLGAARAGFRVALAVESDKHAIAAHRKNFPTCGHLERDIRGVTGAELLREAGLSSGELIGLIGGPPCQGFSVMGRRDLSDPRNKLFRKFFELAEACKPLFFVVENVPGILRAPYHNLRNEAFDLVRGSYKLLQPLLLRASDFGAATIRERVFFIGYQESAFRPFDESSFDAAKIKPQITVGKALEGLPEHIKPDWQAEDQGWRTVASSGRSRFARSMAGFIPEGVGDAVAINQLRKRRLVSGCLGTRHDPSTEFRFRQLAPGQVDRISKSVRLDPQSFCPTLRAGTGSERGSYQAVRPIHPKRHRVITPREAARLQGFPDWFLFAPSKWHSFRQIGNSVSPLVSQAVFSIIRAHFLYPEA